MKRRSQQGIALVVTLILISIITFLAIAFLSVTQRERGSVTTTTHQTEARFAAEAALERAKAEILAPMLANNNALAFDLLVSTNYFSRIGFVPRPRLPTSVDPANVNYDYTVVNAQLSPADMELNIANLLYNPRPPVFLRSNRYQLNMDFRFFLNLNRNTNFLNGNNMFEPTGLVPEVNDAGGYYDLAGNPIPSIIPGNTRSNFVTGDPQWIGLLERPEQPHSANNRFIGRYAYLVVPTGKTLDLNYIHNQAATRALDPASDGFLRNQGAGPWEINLAAFLRDLNTNLWLYDYKKPLSFPNVGTAFEDALSLLRYRYAGSYANLSNVESLFTSALALTTNSVDDYADGPLMLGSAAIDETLPANQDNTTVPWPGANNPNHFFTSQELFDRNKLAPGLFSDRLLSAGMQRSTYNRYTFYRLLSQLDTDTAPDTERINLNYVNVDAAGRVLPDLATNFVSWPPIHFFTNSADALLRTYYNHALTLTNISLYPTNNYGPNVHRLLQVAANLFDATTNRTPFAYADPPSVFRPIFRRDPNGSVFITTYVEETGTLLVDTPPVLVDLGVATGVNGRNQIRAVGTPVNPSDPNEPMVMGVPLIIGAKKGFPNFNEFSTYTTVQISRNLQFRKPDLASPPNETNQMYLVAISSLFGVEAWNSYRTNFPRDLQLYVSADVAMSLTNESGVLYAQPAYATGTVVNIPANVWSGFTDANSTNSFLIPLLGSYLFLTNSVYRQNPPGFVSLSAGFERNTGGSIGFPLPQWWLHVTNRMRFVAVDRQLGRIVDYVSLPGLENHFNLGQSLIGQSVGQEPSEIGRMWLTNRPGASTSLSVPTEGIINQISASLGVSTVPDWNSYSLQSVTGQDKEKAIDRFRVFLRLSPLNSTNTFNPGLSVQTPFNPARKMYIRSTWQANDPLVHYMVGDLTDAARTNLNKLDFITPPNRSLTLDQQLPNLRVVNGRYEPWGGGPTPKSGSTTLYDLRFKDPLVRSSDDWDFPATKFPNVGWIGRVHRGTPWQTIYLKSGAVTNQGTELRTWQDWVGSPNILEALRSRPQQDRLLLDVFTTSLFENTSRGRLSVNQANLAAWSAVLGGVIALTNTATDDDVVNLTLMTPPQRPLYSPLLPPIEPAGVFNPNFPPPLVRIVNGINSVRQTNFFGGAFGRLGDILSVPELTVDSPFLNVSGPQRQFGLSDTVYERIPQQILGLLHGGEPPRFMVYAWGQSLRPADNSLLTSGPFFGMCTNYQIVGETAVRALVQMQGSPDPRDNVFTQPDPRKQYPPRVVVESYNLLPPD